MGKTVRNDPGSPEACREKAKEMLGSGDPERRDTGFSYLLQAYQAGDAEAAFLLGKMVYDGVIEPVEGNAEETGLRILREASERGSVQARALLNSWCMERNGRERETDADTAEPGDITAAPGPLTDFDGRPIRIDRQGLRTPIDAVLEYTGLTNRLTLRANISFLYSADAPVPDRPLFEQAVLHGIRDWQGEYRVFGGQPLEVVLDLTAEDRLWDNVHVIPMAGGEDGGTRSFTFLGFRKWSVSTRKLIFVRTRTGRFDDYEEIRGIVRHEFGHALGLGDLYEEPERGLPGVAKGTYADLDGYHLFDRFYDLVMCSGSGPVSSNDIEMVVLAFRENRMQLYQPEGRSKEVSRALGRGN